MLLRLRLRPAAKNTGEGPAFGARYRVTVPESLRDRVRLVGTAVPDALTVATARGLVTQLETHVRTEDALGGVEEYVFEDPGVMTALIDEADNSWSSWSSWPNAVKKEEEDSITKSTVASCNSNDSVMLKVKQFRIELLYKQFKLLTLDYQ